MTAVYKPTPATLDEVRAIATGVVLCVDEVANDPELDFMGTSSATEIAAACVMLMQQQ